MVWNKQDKATNNKSRQSKQGDQMQNFWVTCQQCKHKFSVPADWIFKYLERIGYIAERQG